MVNLAIIGAGNMARAHLEAISVVEGVSAVGIYSRTREKAISLADQFCIETVASSVDELYRRTLADGVIIAVNETSLERICDDIKKYSWFKLIEKPIGLSLETFDTISSMFDQKLAPAFVAMNRRQYKTVRHVAEIAQRNKAPNLLKIVDQEDALLALRSGREREVCENWHLANSIHLIDLFLLICRGKPYRVDNLLPWAGVFETTFTHSIIYFDSGDIGIYDSIWNAPGPWSMTFESPTERLELRPLEQLYIQEHKKRFSSLMIDETNISKCKPGFQQQIIEFVNAIKRQDTKLLSIQGYRESVLLTQELYS